MKYVDEFTGSVIPYDPTLDVDEYIVCSLPNVIPGLMQPNIGHSTHASMRSAKLAQIKLFLAGTDAWIQHIPPFGPPSIEQQLDAAIKESTYA